MRAVIAKCGVEWSKFRQLYPILMSRHLILATCGRFYNAYVPSAMLHRSETWGARDSDLDQIKRSDRAMRLICRICRHEPNPTMIHLDSGQQR